MPLTVNPSGVLAITIATSWASAVPAETSADGVRLLTDRHGGATRRGCGHRGDLSGWKCESVPGLPRARRAVTGIEVSATPPGNASEGTVSQGRGRDAEADHSRAVGPLP